MKASMKKAFLFMCCMIPFALIGGYFTGIYAYSSYTAEVQQMILAQVGSVEALAVMSGMQAILYACIYGFVGYILADALGLMKPLRPEKEKLIKTLIITAVCGLGFSLDYWTFGRALPQVAALYENDIIINSFSNWMASVFYGGIIEELLMRLFLMSLLSFIIWKVFFRKYTKTEIPAGIFIAANIISAILFAAGHLPATVSTFNGLTPLVVFRCFLLNGVLGMAFGWLYRKYGIQYAMLGHMGTHIISKLIWTVFI